MINFISLTSEEKKLYFEQTAISMNVAPIIIEKDFWVCFTLHKLFSLPDIGENLIFKGGTSLSKVYNVIHRFSEDIDISIDRKSLIEKNYDPEDENIGTNERQRRLAKLKISCQKKINNEILPLLNESISKNIKQENNWTLEKDESDPDDQTILFKYPSSLINIKDGYVKPAVKIEMGARSDHWPSEKQEVTSYVAQKYPEPFKKPHAKVKVLSAERTFWEKATLLHAEYHRKIDKSMPSRLSRHYYDLAMLIKTEIDTDEELLKKVAEHKNIFFKSARAKYDEAKKGSLHISPNPERLKELESDYRKMQEMFFIKPPDFSEIIGILSTWENKFNESN